MAENNDDIPEVTGPAQATEADAAPITAPDGAAGPVLVPRLRDRLWSFRAMLAVAVAAVLIGGAGGAALVAATGDDHHDGPRIGRSRGFDGQRGPDGPGFGGNGYGGQQFRQDGPGVQGLPGAPSGGSTSAPSS